MKKLYLSFSTVLIILSTGCSGTAAITDMNNNQSVIAPVAIPTKLEWEKDKQEVRDRLAEYKKRNDQIKKRNNGWGTAFTIGSTVIGLGGGIMGLANEGSKGIAIAITSSISGALTGLMGTFNFQKNAEQAKGCGEFLDKQVDNFLLMWGPGNYPDTQAKYNQYYREKGQVIKAMSEKECYGN